MRRPMTPAIAVALGGALGACLRVALGDVLAAEPGGWPLATLLANLAGTALLAAIAGSLVRMRVEGRVLAFLGGGLCGALTTFSTLQVETIRLAEDEGLLAAAAYGGTSLAAGLAVAVAAYALASRRIPRVSA